MTDNLKTARAVYLQPLEQTLKNLTIALATSRANVKMPLYASMRRHAHRQLALFVPLSRALKAYLNQQHVGSVSPTDAGYRHYQKLFEALSEKVNRATQDDEGRFLLSELGPALAGIALPVPDADIRGLRAGFMSITDFVGQAVEANRAAAREYRRKKIELLASLTTTQVTLLLEMVDILEDIPRSAAGVTLTKRELVTLQPST